MVGSADLQLLSYGTSDSGGQGAERLQIVSLFW